MKTGIVRRIDDLGRIVIPQDVRNKIGIKVGDPLEISFDGNKICLELYTPSYDDAINYLIDNIKTDMYLTKGKRKAISALKMALEALNPEKGGE